MGSSSQTCFFCHRNRQLIIPLLLFLISSLTLMKSMAEGRANNKLLLQLEEATQVEEEEKVMVRRSVMIGSRPPSCERKCNSCVHCEAVQVPVTTKAAITNKNRSAHFSSAAAAAAAAGIADLAYSRGDDITNYKPMSWKCKCGNFFFNP